MRIHPRIDARRQAVLRMHKATHGAAAAIAMYTEAFGLSPKKPNAKASTNASVAYKADVYADPLESAQAAANALAELRRAKGSKNASNED